jgi:hypothetical protein
MVTHRESRHNASELPSLIAILTAMLLAAVLDSTAFAQKSARAAKANACVHPQVLIAGGDTLLQSTGETPLAIAELYDVATKTFSSAGNMVVARFWHTATTLRDGRVLLAGGYDLVGPTATAEIYDPATGTFSATGSMSVPRVLHTATLLRDGTVLVTGGVSTDNTDVTSAEIYNPIIGSFTLTGPMTIAREAQSATLLNTGAVLIAGGYNAEGPLQSAELYFPRRHRFVRIHHNLVATVRPGNSEGEPATLLRNGTVLMVGESDPNACCPSGVNEGAEIYHPWFRSFHKTKYDLQEIRTDPTITLLHDGKVLIAGGYPLEGELDDAEIYNPTSQTFTLTDNVMSSERGGHTATLLPDGSVLLAGGLAPGTQAGQIRDQFPQASADLYDPATRLFTPTAGEMAVARAGHTANLVCSP